MRHKNTPNTEADFWSHVEKTDGCWLWTASTTGDGYGQFFMRGRKWLAHRLSYWFSRGEHPGFLEVRHSCDETRCVRPEHLLLGTHQQNVQDRQDRKRQAFGARNGRAKLNDDVVRRLRSRYTGKRGEVPRLSAEFGINEGIVRDIIKRKTWRHVTPQFCNGGGESRPAGRSIANEPMMSSPERDEAGVSSDGRLGVVPVPSRSRSDSSRGSVRPVANLSLTPSIGKEARS